MGYSYGYCCCSPCGLTDFSGGITGNYVAAPFSGSVDPVFRYASSQLVLDNGTPTASGSYLRSPARTGRDIAISGAVYKIPTAAPAITPVKTGIVVASAYGVWMNWSDRTIRYAAADAVGEVGAGTIAHTFGSVQTSQTLYLRAYELPNLNYNVFFAYENAGSPVFVAAVYDVAPSGLTGNRVKFGVFGDEGGGWANFVTACTGSGPCGSLCADGAAVYWTFTPPTPGDFGADTVLNYVAPTGPLGSQLQSNICVWTGTAGSMTIDTTDTAAWPLWTFTNVGGGHYQRDVAINWHLFRDTGATGKVRVGLLASPTGGIGTTPAFIALYEIDTTDFECLDANTLASVSDTSATLAGTVYSVSEHFSWDASVSITPQT